ncbi:MAG: DUF488 domain-containing protein [Pseudomonadota bacterium]|nr:DUF488 domain-containing protein [Pseudomonadota bacterium]
MAKKTSLTIATIGYEKSGFGDLAATLQADRVTHVLDVRELPLSRRAGFSKRQLAAGLAEVEIRYTHLRGLGTPKAGRVAAHAGHMAEFERIFAAHMKTEVAQTELQRAARLVVAEACCLLCFEADPTCCHRRVVAEALHGLTGLPIKHLHVTAL